MNSHSALTSDREGRVAETETPFTLLRDKVKGEKATYCCFNNGLTDCQNCQFSASQWIKQLNYWYKKTKIKMREYLNFDEADAEVSFF